MTYALVLAIVVGSVFGMKVAARHGSFGDHVERWIRGEVLR